MFLVTFCIPSNFMRSVDITLLLQLIKLDTSNLERKINNLDKKNSGKRNSCRSDQSIE